MTENVLEKQFTQQNFWKEKIEGWKKMETRTKGKAFSKDEGNVGRKKIEFAKAYPEVIYRILKWVIRKKKKIINIIYIHNPCREQW